MISLLRIRLRSLGRGGDDSYNFMRTFAQRCVAANDVFGICRAIFFFASHRVVVYFRGQQLADFINFCLNILKIFIAYSFV